MYNIDPQRRQAYKDSAKGFGPVERELVFDIDMTDYDDVRTCGSEGHICCKCWPYMAAAIKVVLLCMKHHWLITTCTCCGRLWMLGCERTLASSTCFGSFQGVVACTAGYATNGTP